MDFYFSEILPSDRGKFAFEGRPLKCFVFVILEQENVYFDL